MSGRVFPEELVRSGLKQGGPLYEGTAHGRFKNATIYHSFGTFPLSNNRAESVESESARVGVIRSLMVQQTKLIVATLYPA